MTYTHSSFIYNRSKLQIFTNNPDVHQQQEKLQTVVYPYNRIILSKKKKHITDMHKNIDQAQHRLQKYYTEQKRQTQKYVTVFEILEQSNLIYSHRKRKSAGCWGGGGGLQMGIRELSYVAGSSLHLGCWK